MSFKYEKRFVAFIDVLGFSGQVKKSVTSLDALQTICESIYLISDYVREAKQDLELPSDTTCVTQFSDSIVISVKFEDNHRMLALFQLLKKIQIALISQGVLLRGGIVLGDLIHTDEILVGPGLITAYHLESKCAHNPRIVIDPKVLWQYTRDAGIRKDYRLKTFDYHKTFVEDGDGTFFIDYFNDLNLFTTVDAEQYFIQLCTLIKDNIDSADISVRMKYLWMRERVKQSEYFDRYKLIYKDILTDRNKKSKPKI